MDPLSLGLAVALFSLLGLAAGTVTGLAPGLHVNNVALILLASRPAFEGLVLAAFPGAGPDEVVSALSAFVMGTVIGHSFLDFVPSVYLGAPEERTALSVLPGHRMLLAGQGHAAVRHAARGALAGVAVSVALLVPVRLLLGPPVDAYGRAEGAIAIILLGIVAFLILAERQRGGGTRPSSAWRQRGVALLVFLAAGALGYTLLDTPWLTSWNWFPLGPLTDEPGSLILFPLFTGLFGFSTLVLASHSRSELPSQDLGRGAALPARSSCRGILSGAAAGALVSWLPGLSSGAATAVAQLLSRGRREESSPEAGREFMVALGSVSTSTSVFTVAVLFIIDRARSGAAVAIRELAAGSVAPWDPVGSPPSLLLALLASAGVAALAAYPVTIACSRLLARRIHRVRYDVLARGVIATLAVLIFVLAGTAGLLISFVACVLGLVPPLAGVKRVHLMGCLILPVIAFYAGVV